MRRTGTSGTRHREHGKDSGTLPEQHARAHGATFETRVGKPGREHSHGHDNGKTGLHDNPTPKRANYTHQHGHQKAHTSQHHEGWTTRMKTTRRTSCRYTNEHPTSKKLAAAGGLAGCRARGGASRRGARGGRLSVGLGRCTARLKRSSWAGQDGGQADMARARARAAGATRETT